MQHSTSKKHSSYNNGRQKFKEADSLSYTQLSFMLLILFFFVQCFMFAYLKWLPLCMRQIDHPSVNQRFKLFLNLLQFHPKHFPCFRCVKFHALFVFTNSGKIFSYNQCHPNRTPISFFISRYLGDANHTYNSKFSPAF